MASIPQTIQTWQMIRPWAKDKETGQKIPGLIELKEIPVPELQEDEVLVEVAGCGVCHTDLGYFYDGVPTVNKPPLTLGHEVSGTVVAGKSDLIGKNVLIPAVMPCGRCEICGKHRGNRCLKQRMLGNSHDIYGGFSSHVPFPSEGLCVIEDTQGLPLSHYAVIADAATTPYQAAKRADVTDGEVAVVIGAGGGIGVYMVQIAKALGAKTVIGLERDEEKLARSLKYGADLVINTADKDVQTIRNEFKETCKANSVQAGYGLKIFECSGTQIGQQMGLTLLTFVSKLIIIGFGLHSSEYMFSRLMAFDAEIIGTWACLPEYYPKVLELVQSGKVQIEPFLETRPMSRIVEVFEDQHAGKFTRRIVLEPDF